MGNRWNLLKKAFIPLIPGLILVLGSLALFALSLDQSDRRVDYMEGRTREARQSLRAIIGALRPFAETVAEKGLVSSSIRGRLEAAWDGGDTPYREGLADEVRREVEPIYDIIRAKGFCQIQYHFPDATLFLGLFPDATKKGDGTKGMHFIVQLANASLEPVEGFETDRALSGYHFVYPLASPSGRPLGSVSLTLCPVEILPLLEDLVGGTFFFLESEGDIEAKGLSKERPGHVPFPCLDGFLVERSLLSRLRGTEGLDLKTLGELCRSLPLQQQQRLTEGAAFSTTLTHEKASFRATFLPLLSLRKEVVGYMVGFVPDRTEMVMRERYISLMVGSGITFLLLAFMTWTALRNHLAVEQLATWDPLTGALFRKPFLREAERELVRSLRHRRPLAWIMFDIDHFKEVNDSLGHAAGDRLLRALGHAVAKGIRTSDFLARWGGDEFLILAPETSELQAIRLAERIMDLAASLNVPGAPLKLSIGVHLQQPDDGIDESLRKVDETLYRAKRLGRNRIVRSSQP